jgi:methionine-rich copper-binding protein CopC
MKKLSLIFTAIVVVASLTTTVMAQNNVTASSPAGAKIVAALTLANDQKLDFGTMSIPDANVNVTLSTGLARTSDNPTHIALMADQLLNAHYKVTGAAGYLYTITLPVTGAVQILSGGNSMHVDGFTVKPTSRGTDVTQGTLDVNGKDEFVVGATLKLLGGQAPGTYAGSFDVTIFYN